MCFTGERWRYFYRGINTVLYRGKDGLTHMRPCAETETETEIDIYRVPGLGEEKGCVTRTSAFKPTAFLFL